MSVCHSPQRVGIAIQTVIVLLAVSGCASTKWAMDEDRYAQDHSAPYSADPVQRLLQQRREMVDAEFQEGNSGVYVGGGSTTGHWPAAIGSLGRFWMPTSCSSLRMGVIGMDDGGIGVGGGEIGARIHAPTRLTPYVGLSSVAGMSGFHSRIGTHNTRYTRVGQKYTAVSGMVAIVPEVGVSYWVTSSTRLNLGASYFVVDGGKPDFLLYGLSMEFSTRGSSIPANPYWEDYDTFPQPTEMNGTYPPLSGNGLDRRFEETYGAFESDQYFAQASAAGQPITNESKTAEPIHFCLTFDKIESATIFDLPIPLVPASKVFAIDSPPQIDKPDPLHEADTHEMWPQLIEAGSLLEPFGMKTRET